MTDKKLTDSEIIKALDEAELFLQNRTMDGKSLKLNEYDIGILRNISQVCAKAYDEINRLQAENERLRNAYKQCAFERDAYIEIENTAIAEAKAEAYKEFAEKAKEFMHNKFKALDEYEFEYITERDIDNLLKEMVGENNATT